MRAAPTSDESSPHFERRILQSFAIFAAEELLDNEEKHFGSPESLTAPFKQYNTRLGTYCWHSNISASKKLWEMSNLWSYGWLVEGSPPPSPPPSSKPLSKTEPLESFWLRPSKAEGSCIPHFPWDLMKYTASGLLSIWSFRLLNQWKKDPSCHKRHMFGVTCCSGVLMPVVDIISTPYTLITIHSVQTLQSALRQTVF